MSQFEKIILKILSGTSDRNIKFSELRKVLFRLGFLERIKGSHHIFSKEEVIEIINIQEANNGLSKPYQVKQVRELIVTYKLSDNIKS